MSTAAKPATTVAPNADAPKYTLIRRNPQERPMTAPEAKAIYEWSGEETDCPDELFVNASASPVIVGSMAQLPFDNPRVYPGDRVFGSFYVEVARLGNNLIPLKKLSIERRLELEKARKQRTGDEPADWVRVAWAKKDAAAALAVPMVGAR